jgi:hypothetical protein
VFICMRDWLRYRACNQLDCIDLFGDFQYTEKQLNSKVASSRFAGADPLVDPSGYVRLWGGLNDLSTRFGFGLVGST